MSIKYTFLKAKASKRRYISLKVSSNCEELNTILNISTRDKDNGIDGESIVSLTIPKTITMEGTEKINIDIIAPRFLEGFGLNINYIEFEEGITLSQEAFCDSYVINTVFLPKGITSIPDKCFFSSTLSKLQNTNSLESIGREAFARCDRLESINLPDTINKISEKAFCESGLKRFVWPEQCRIVPEFCFFRCNHLNQVVNLENVYAINQGAFQDSAIAVIKFDNVKSVASEAFSQCNFLTEIKWSNECSVIPPKCFLGCLELKKISNTENVSIIQDEAFAHTNLTNVSSFSNVTYIGNAAFYGCGLTRFFWPESCKVIPKECFRQCRRLKGIIGIEGVMEIEEFAFAFSGLSQFTWPSSCRNISNGCFMGCEDLSDFEITPGMYSISQKAFLYAAPNLSLDLSSCIISLKEDIQITFGTTYVKLPFYCI